MRNKIAVEPTPAGPGLHLATGVDGQANEVRRTERPDGRRGVVGEVDLHEVGQSSQVEGAIGFERQIALRFEAGIEDDRCLSGARR